MKKEHKLVTRIINCGLNPKRELTILLTILFLVTIGISVLAYFMKNYYILISLVALIPGICLLFYGRYSLYEEDKRKKLESEFLEVFSYIRIYLVNNNNVYNAIKKANEYTSKEMNYEISVFLSKVDDDKSIIPFLEFGSRFKNKTIEEVLISLHQMIDGGFTESYLNQFINIFENFRNRVSLDNMNKRYKRLDGINHMSLIGSAYLMLVILVVIVKIIGEMSNGF